MTRKTSIPEKRIESEPINAGPLPRLLTLLVVKAKTQRYLRRLWKPSRGLLSISKFCIKVYAFDNLAEAHAMQFVARQTSIPVPKVYCAFVHRGRTYIVMKNIDGQMAADGWVSRPEESKRRILNQLRDMDAELRAITPPDGVGVANVDGGPFCDCRLPSKLLWGPFATIRDFHEALADGIDVAGSYKKLPPDLQELFDFYQQPCGKLVFTHGDLSSLNILVRGDDVVGIIDWETAGWFPSYWEYSCAWHVNPQNEFWQQEVDKFLTPMPYELRMDKIRHKYFGAF
jgi:aminoglycoside phosphotransferase